MAESQTQKLSQAALFHFLAPPHSSLEIPTPALKERSEPKSHLGPITHALLNPLVCTDHASRRCKHFTPVSNQPSEPAGITTFINHFQIPTKKRDAFAVAHLDTLHATHPLVGLSACCYSYIHPSIHTNYLVRYNYWAAHCEY
jgi:hypothetical protein